MLPPQGDGGAAAGARACQQRPGGDAGTPAGAGALGLAVACDGPRSGARTTRFVNGTWQGKQVGLTLIIDSPRTGLALETSQITGVELQLQILGTGGTPGTGGVAAYQGPCDALASGCAVPTLRASRSSMNSIPSAKPF